MSGQARALTPGEHDEMGIPLDVVVDRAQRLVDARRAWESILSESVWQDHSRRWDAFRDAQDEFDAVGVSAAFLLTHLLAQNAALAAELARAQAGAQTVGPTFEQAVKRLLSSGTSEDYSIVLVARAQSLGQCRRVVYGMTHDLQGRHLSGHDENEYEGYFFEARLPDESRALAQASAEGAGAGEVAG